jgi:CHAT domain-containing protein
LTGPPPPAAADEPSVADLLEKGSLRYRQGEVARAADIWQSAAVLAEKERDPAARLEALLSRARALQALGHHDRALAVLQSATAAVEAAGGPAQQGLFYARLGDLYLSLGQTDAAVTFLEKGEDAATAGEAPYALAVVLNNTGIAHASRKEYVDAVAAWKECRYLLDQMADGPDLRSRVLINLARVSLRLGNPQAVAETVREALAAVGRRADSHEKGRDLISLGQIAMEGRDVWPDAAGEMARPALSALKGADAIAADLADPELRSLARGYLGRLYERDGQREAALRLTLSALFYAQQSGTSPEIRYRWHWQAGRLHEGTGDRDGAIRSYRLAVEALTPIRRELTTGYRDPRGLFQEKIRPVYLALARLLLEKAADGTDRAARESLLREGRETMELLKTVELQEYFQDPCVADLESAPLQPEAMADQTAVIYPIPFRDELAIMLITRDAADLFTVPVTAAELDRTVRRFRRRLQNSRGQGFREEGRLLYDWLIRPLEPTLSDRRIRTLVVAPDGVLRLIPFAPLHDGDRFLIEQYAVGTVPALTLTRASSPAPRQGGVLLEGLSKARQGFASLPGVKEELRALQDLMGGTVLLDEDYTLENLDRAFATTDHPIVHMATHGVFGGSSDETFLLTHDDKLTMDRLEELIGRTRRRGNQVDLLTLSACQTALGDEWAAFGLAGIAVKAGVSSAVATLWYADDEAAIAIMTDFYRHLRAAGDSKARALQQAQIRMIRDDRFDHPAFWAPFLLIGNWS